MKAPHTILLRPLLTEKANGLKEQLKQVTFEVAPTANKIEIRHAVEVLFPGVQVGSVRTSVSRGKWKRQGKFLGRRKNWKRAVVTLTEGDIDFFQEQETEA
jgi:large subunit ribosomal protein L23